VKKVVIHKPGDYRQLVIEEHPDLTPAADEILIDVATIGVNYADCVTRMGLYASAKHYVGYPITPGFEVAGTISAVGKEIADLAPGTQVMAVMRFNACATQVVVKRDQVVALPARLNLAQAAAFPAVSLTAWYAMFELAHPYGGNTLLVHSAAGGVGSVLVQLGKIAGCRVVGVVGSAHKTGAVMKLGVDAVIDKSSEDLWERAEQLAPEGYHVIFDANGVTTLKQSYRHLAPTGKLVVYGFHTMLPKTGGIPNKLKLAWNYWRTPRFSPFSLTTNNHSVLGFNLSFLFDRTDIMREGLQQLLKWLDEGRLVTPTVTEYAFEEVGDAHRALESGRTVGKLVLRC
jgi:NADPH:quinone reductase-like Zn-dependent oxidoreductase